MNSTQPFTQPTPMTLSTQTYNFQNRPVRVAGSPEDPLFCAADVCAVLELEQVTAALRNVPDDEVTKSKIIDSMGRNQEALFLTEAGLYRVIFRSNKAEAESFRRWVMHDVLPSVRKTGAYVQPGMSALDQFEAMIKVAREQERRLAEQDQKLAEVRTLAIQANSYNSSNTGFFTVRAFANVHGFRLSLSEAKAMGRQAASICRRDGVTMGHARDELFGEVNSYPIEVLEEVFDAAFQKGERL